MKLTTAGYQRPSGKNIHRHQDDRNAALGDPDRMSSPYYYYSSGDNGGRNIATTHLVIAEDADHQGIIDSANRTLADRFAIQHATIQVEHVELANKCKPCDPAAATG